ncbi:hypothetical protein NKJ71_13915 [Mesorhizobium sp. M0050]|uniref:hypothetical protein n=1 Tax=Mesorhizobium sp. M0050 TaxID=2956861 RepID=UPI00333BF425
MKLREKIGVGLAFIGLSIFGACICRALWFWFTDIVPFFLERGNVWPAAVPVALAAFVIGLALQSSTQESDN